MVKLQLASSTAAEPRAAAPGNPSFPGSGRAHVAYPSITPLLVSTDKLWWSKIGKTCLLAGGQRAHKGQALTGIQLFYLFLDISGL